MATKEQLIAWFADGLAATGEKFEALITSLKGRQSTVSDPVASGTSVTFISNISQDQEGVIAATKKTVSFSGYQTTAGMAGYQNMDLQQVGVVTAIAGGNQTITHNMKHYPTVRLIDVGANVGEEVDVSLYTVKHSSDLVLDIYLDATLTGSYKYILD